MVDALGGKISLESRDGKGSTFSVLLPLAPRAVDQPLQRRPRKDAAGPWPVLIVEDNFLNEAVMERFLQSLCNVDHARDGRSAVQMVQKKEYAAILMDINLGAGISGVEAAREIRRIPGYEQVPIIAVTGYALAGDRERLLAEGLTHYLPKPFDEHELLSVVTDALK
jgi:CheY-like chemotaxis protein